MIEVRVPSPGEAISEVEISEWMVSDGDKVEKDQIIAEIDSDKATLEMPAEASGTIHIKVEAGETVPVNAVICTIEDGTGPTKKTPVIEKADVTYTGRKIVNCPTCGKAMKHYSGQNKYVCCEHWLDADKF